MMGSNWFYYQTMTKRPLKHATEKLCDMTLSVRKWQTSKQIAEKEAVRNKRKEKIRNT